MAPIKRGLTYTSSHRTLSNPL